MPSAAQRRRRAKAALEPPAHSKVIHLEDDDGWTHVARTSTKGARSTAKAVPPEFRDASQNIASRDAKIEVHYTAQELARHYDRIASAWRACPERASLAESIRSHASVASAITSSVCLGLGSPSRMFMTMGSLKQLAIWLDMLNIIFEVSSTKVKALAQDPVFNTVDRKFLPDCGVEIIDHPAASNYIDGHCFVYGPHFSMAYAPREMRVGGAPLTVCNNVVPFIEGSPWVQETLPDNVDPKSAETRREWQDFLQARESSPFLGNGKQAFDMQVNDMCVYWKTADVS